MGQKRKEPAGINPNLPPKVQELLKQQEEKTNKPNPEPEVETKVPIQNDTKPDIQPAPSNMSNEETIAVEDVSEIANEVSNNQTQSEQKKMTNSTAYSYHNHTHASTGEGDENLPTLSDNHIEFQ